MLFDTHCHLDDGRLFQELDAVLERAEEAGVRRITTIGCANDVATVMSAVAIARQHPDRISATVGVHPHDARHLDDEICDAIREAGVDPSVVAIGETGLDFHYDHSPHPVQKEAFRKQIAIAKELQKPLVVHTRSAPQETLQILREEQAQDVGGIIHCFSEDAPFAAAALDLGFVSSFSGIVTFKKAVAVHEAALKQPADALLVETDAPYLAPMPKRGKRNEPAYVAYTAARIAELRGEDPEALAHTTYQNALRIFGIEE
ncbi:MAG: TatD family deoxyribonuclease [Deltaproteobacteria bacterium]|nr:MAG: TatD family deoxyribonuclease [Deltaproteobacteria bacterium]UCF48321.1 MAG: TatD family hydrolase [Myxococcales bacterium]